MSPKTIRLWCTLHCPTPDVDTVEGEVVSLPPRPGEDSGLRRAEQDSDLGSVIKEIRTPEKKFSTQLRILWCHLEKQVESNTESQQVTDYHWQSLPQFNNGNILSQMCTLQRWQNCLRFLQLQKKKKICDVKDSKLFCCGVNTFIASKANGNFVIAKLILPLQNCFSDFSESCKKVKWSQQSSETSLCLQQPPCVLQRQISGSSAKLLNCELWKRSPMIAD